MHELTVYNTMTVLDHEAVKLDGIEYACKFGKHCIWIPKIEAKIIWSYNGRIESIRDIETSNNYEVIARGKFNATERGFDYGSKLSIISEVFIFHKLSQLNMSPKTKGMLYIKNVTSSFIHGVPHCDCSGMYGYFIEDACSLKDGKFDQKKFKERAEPLDIVIPSVNALGDLVNPGNVVNGYLVDLRRTLWDMIHLDMNQGQVETAWKRFAYNENEDELVDKIRAYSQFPHKERDKNYQSFYMGGTYKEGSRDTEYRMQKMGLPHNLTDKTVLDLGCNLGAICSECLIRGARKVVGIDFEQDYIECARDLARFNGFHINFMRFDLMKALKFAEYANTYYRGEIDVVFALALWKHIKENLWIILDNIRWKTCYIESHNAPEELRTAHVQKMVKQMGKLKGLHEVKYMGQTSDRSPRCTWKLTSKRARVL